MMGAWRCWSKVEVEVEVEVEGETEGDDEGDDEGDGRETRWKWGGGDDIAYEAGRRKEEGREAGCWC